MLQLSTVTVLLARSLHCGQRACPFLRCGRGADCRVNHRSWVRLETLRLHWHSRRGDDEQAGQYKVIDDGQTSSRWV
jgi:hypothetical protein